MPVVSTYQITRSATPFKTRGRPPFTPTGLSAGNKGLATSKNSSGIKPVAIAHLLVHGFMRQVCTRKSHAKFGFCQRFLVLQLRFALVMEARFSCNERSSLLRFLCWPAQEVLSSIRRTPP